MQPTKQEKVNSNRMVNITCMVAGCLLQSAEQLEKYLQETFQEQVREDKMLLNQVLSTTKRLKYQLDQLEKRVFFRMGNDQTALDSYDDSVFMYWALFLLILDRAGTDGYSDLRFHAFYVMISKYKSLLNLPNLDLSYSLAFTGLEKAIAAGKYSKEDFKNLFKYENRDKETEGKV